MWFGKKSQQAAKVEAALEKLDEAVAKITSEPELTVEERIEARRQAAYENLLDWEKRLIDFDTPQKCPYCGGTAFKRELTTTYHRSEVHDYCSFSGLSAADIVTASLPYFRTTCAGCSCSGANEKTLLVAKVSPDDIKVQRYRP